MSLYSNNFIYFFGQGNFGSSLKHVTKYNMHYCAINLFPDQMGGKRNILGEIFMFFKQPTKIEEIFTVHLTLTTLCQINSEDFVKFCGLLRKHKVYQLSVSIEFQKVFSITRTFFLTQMVRTKYQLNKMGFTPLYICSAQ